MKHILVVMHGTHIQKRYKICKTSVRLDMMAREMENLAHENTKTPRSRWPGAPYLSFVDSKHHARLLAMARLGILPLEIEVGRWQQKPREERFCSLG